MSGFKEYKQKKAIKNGKKTNMVQQLKPTRIKKTKCQREQGNISGQLHHALSRSSFKIVAHLYMVP